MTARLWLTVLLVLTAWLYSPLLSAPFVFEDAQALASAPVWDVPGRGLTAWTWAVTPDPASAHTLNLALHLVNGALVFLVASVVTSPLAALCGAGVFLLHPLSSEAVAYATGRAELLVTGFTLLAVWLALRWTVAAGWWRLVLCAVAVIGAALSKEIGLLAIPLVALSVRVWRPHWPASAFVINALLLGAGVIVGQSWWRIETWSVAANAVYDWPTFAAYQLTAIWHLLALVVWPVGFSIDHDIVGLSPRWTLAAGLLTVQVVALAMWAWDRAPLVTWALLWVAIWVAPRFLFASTEFVKEYQLLPAWAGLSVALGAAMAALVPITAPAWRQRTA